MPSSRLHSRRSWQNSAAASSKPARSIASSAWPESQKLAPESSAMTIPDCEIWFGVTAVAASRRVIALAQRVPRLASGRRFGSSDIA
jgi:hypothetical protein